MRTEWEESVDQLRKIGRLAFLLSLTCVRSSPVSECEAVIDNTSTKTIVADVRMSDSSYHDRLTLAPLTAIVVPLDPTTDSQLEIETDTGHKRNVGYFTPPFCSSVLVRLD